ncbi:MAG: IS4 family transposase, partial [Microcystaceae cyanobacterium]
MSWADEELEFVNLGDTRLNQRLKRIVSDLASYPEASVPQASRDAAAMQGTYDFWSNRHIKPAQIQQAHAQKTAERAVKHQIVLDIQDTTKLDFTSHRSLRKKGVRNPLCEGLWVHTSLCATTQGVPLGILHQKTWTREKGKNNSNAPPQEKESKKWLESVLAVQQWLPSNCQVITIGDREADIYELLTTIASVGRDFIIRAFHNRIVEIANPQSQEEKESQKLKQALVERDPLGKMKLSVPRAPSREAREVLLTIKVCRIKLSPPRNHRNRQNLPSLEVTALLAEEENAPEKKGISWFLLTSLAVETLAQAKECLKLYSLRWLI